MVPRAPARICFVLIVSCTQSSKFKYFSGKAVLLRQHLTAAALQSEELTCWQFVDGRFSRFDLTIFANFIHGKERTVKLHPQTYKWRVSVIQHNILKYRELPFVLTDTLLKTPLRVKNQDWWLLNFEMRL